MTGRRSIYISPDRAERIISAISDETGVPAHRIRSKRRGLPDASVARDAVYAEMRRIGASYPTIGSIMDRDHSSVIAGVRRHQQRQGHL